MPIWWFWRKQAHWCLVCCRFVRVFYVIITITWRRLTGISVVSSATFPPLASGWSGWGPHRGNPQPGSRGSGLFPLGTSSLNWSTGAEEREDKCGAALQTTSKRNFRLLSTETAEREMCIAASLGCLAAAAVSEHGLNHELMNDSSRGLAEVGSIRERHRDASFTAPHYLNWKEYLYQLGDQKLMEAVMHQLSYIKMSAGKGRDNYSLLKIFNFLKLPFFLMLGAVLAHHSQS